MTAIDATIGLRLFAGLHSGMDLAIFDQAVRSLSRFRMPVSAMKSPGMSLWGDHLHLILVVAAPFYWIWDDPRMLLIVQALAIGLATALLTAYAARLLRHRGAAAVVAVSFAGALGVQYGAVFDFHEVALGMPLLAGACGSFLTRRWRAFVIWSVLLLTVKEDAAVLVFGLALVAWLQGQRRIAASLAGASVLWTCLAIEVIIPALSPVGRWPYSNPLTSPFVVPSTVADALVHDGGLSSTLFLLFAGGLFLAGRSRLAIAVVPNMITRAITPDAAYWRIFNHYNLLPCVIIAFASLDALTRSAARRRWVAGLACVSILSVAFGPGVRQGWQADDPVRLADAAQLIASVPDEESVAADAYLTPHFTRRHPVTQQVRPAGHGNLQNYTDDLGRPLVARYVVLDRGTSSNGGAWWVAGAVQHFKEAGYTVYAERGDFIGLRRGA